MACDFIELNWEMKNKSWNWLEMMKHDRNSSFNQKKTEVIYVNIQEMDFREYEIQFNWLLLDETHICRNLSWLPTKNLLRILRIWEHNSWKKKLTKSFKCRYGNLKTSTSINIYLYMLLNSGFFPMLFDCNQ